MPYPDDMIRVQIRGSLLDAPAGNQVEEFVHGFTMRPNAPVVDDNDWQPLLTALAQQIATEFEAAWAFPVPGEATAIRTRFPATVRYDEVRCYHVNPAGATEHIGNEFISVPNTGSGDVSLPPQCSVVVSLYAYPLGEFNPHGRRGRGRFYLPPMSRTQVDVGGVLVAGAQDAVADWWDQVFDAIQTGGAECSLELAGNDGVWRDVERIRVGRIVDTQRRRRSSLEENYIDRGV